MVRLDDFLRLITVTGKRVTVVCPFGRPRITSKVVSTEKINSFRRRPGSISQTRNNHSVFRWLDDPVGGELLDSASLRVLHEYDSWAEDTGLVE